jgi:hypothetical protein
MVGGMAVGMVVAIKFVLLVGTLFSNERVVSERQPPPQHLSTSPPAGSTKKSLQPRTMPKQGS